MTELEKIKRLEYYFPEIFAEKEERGFGIMFHDADNFDSNDANHAIIFPDRNYDFQKAINEIKQFYNSKNLEPRIYSCLKALGEENRLQILAPYLERAGFEIHDYGYQDYSVYCGRSGITEPYTLEFRRFNAGDDLNVFSKITDEESAERVKKVISRRVKNPDYYLYIGYINNEPAVMASFQFDENMTARLDEVETAEAHRGKGYARQMTRHLTGVFEKAGGKLFFTWAANDTAQRVYTEGGFEVKYKLHHWSAYIL